MTLEEINNIELESVFHFLFDRIIDLSPLEPGEPSFMMDEDESKSFYDRVIVNQKLVKPSLELFEAELEEYKSELRAIENSRLAEVARVKDIKDRFKALKDIRLAFDEAGFSIANPKIELKRIIKENDQERLALLEEKDEKADKKQKKKEKRAKRKQKGNGAREFCFAVIDIIAGHNVENNVSEEDLDTLEASYGPVLQSLMVFRPKKAKTLISAIEPDGALITEELKEEILDFFTEHGL